MDSNLNTSDWSLHSINHLSYKWLSSFPNGGIGDLCCMTTYGGSFLGANSPLQISEKVNEMRMKLSCEFCMWNHARADGYLRAGACRLHFTIVLRSKGSVLEHQKSVQSCGQRGTRLNSLHQEMRVTIHKQEFPFLLYTTTCVIWWHMGVPLLNATTTVHNCWVMRRPKHMWASGSIPTTSASTLTRNLPMSRVNDLRSPVSYKERYSPRKRSLHLSAFSDYLVRNKHIAFQNRQMVYSWLLTLESILSHEEKNATETTPCLSGGNVWKYT